MDRPVSVVIPLAPQDFAWQKLLPTLELPDCSEIILACGQQEIDTTALENTLDCPVVLAFGGSGRAQQMNIGAGAAKHEWLWFLHADSRMSKDTAKAVVDTVSQNKDGLFFFDLKFLADGPAAMKWNQMAVKWRSRRLKIPFGDQGFLIKKRVFQILGGYREDLSYGEDHVLVWKVRQDGYSVLPTGGSLYTSARKYRRGGWLKTTLHHVWLTIVQAAPNWLVLQKRRIEHLFS